MEPNVKEGLLEIEDTSFKEVRDFDIDVIIKDFIALGTDKVLSNINLKEVSEKIDKLINSERSKLNQSLLQAIQARLNYEQNESDNKYNEQIQQKQTAIQNQLNQESETKVQAVQQILDNMLKSNAFANQKHYDRVVAEKKAEIEAYRATRLQQLQNQFNQDVSPIEAAKAAAGKAITTTAQSIYEQKYKDLSSVIVEKSGNLIEELVKLLQEKGNSIDVESIENYNKIWLSSLLLSINNLANKSFQVIATQVLTSDNKTFEQFIDTSGKKELIIHNDRIVKLLTDVKDKRYTLQTDALEKLFSIIDEPSYSKIHSAVLSLILYNAQNSTTPLSSIIFKKLEKLLEDQQYNLVAAKILLDSVGKNKQNLPESILTKLSYIAGDKGNIPLLLEIATLAISVNLAQGNKLPENIINSFLDNNFIHKIYNQDSSLVAARHLTSYFNKYSESYIQYSDKIIGIIGDSNLNHDIRGQLCIIVQIAIQNGYKLSKNDLEKLESALEKFPLSKTLEIAEALEAVVKVQKIHLQPTTLIKLLTVIQDQEIEPPIRIKILEVLLSIIEKGQDIEESSVRILIKILTDPEIVIKKKTAEVIKYLFKSPNSNDYSLSTEEIDLSSAMLSSTTIAEIRDALAYVIGLHAGKDITTKNAVKVIYDLIKAEYFSNDVVFALKNVSGNHKEELPISILEKLMSIGINENNNASLRICALESFANLSGLSGISLPLPTIEKLLHDSNPIVKDLAIKLVKYHFERTKILPVTLIQSLAGNSLSSELLSKSALEILGFVVNKGESLPKEALDLIGWVLCNHNDPDIRTKAFIILDKCGTYSKLEKELATILEIEKLSQSISITSEDNEKITVAKSLQQHAKSGVKFTKGCFHTLQGLLNNSDKTLLEITANTISYLIDSNQEIPTDILIAVKNCLLSNHDLPSLVIVFDKLIKVTSFSDDEMLMITEKLLISDKSPDLAKECMRHVLKTLTGRGKYLSNETIEHISLYLLNTPLDKVKVSEVQIEFAYILYHIITNGQTLPNNVHSALIHCLNSSNEEVRSVAISCLKDTSSRGKSFSESELVLIRSFLKHGLTPEVEQNILKILQNVSLHSKQSFIEVELDKVIHCLNTNPNDLDSINRIVLLLKETSFVPKQVIVTLTQYLTHENSQIVELCIKGLSIILSKIDKLALTTEQIAAISSLLNINKDNTDIIALLEYTQKENISLSNNVLIKLIDYLELEPKSVHKEKVVVLLEKEHNKFKFDPLLADLFYLARNQIDTSFVSSDKQELLKVVKALKSTVDLGKNLSSLQLQILEQGLKHNAAEIINASTDCLGYLLSHYDYSIDEHFIKTALLTIKDEQFFNFFQKLYRNVLKNNVGLLGEVIARVEMVLDKHNSLLMQGQILGILKFLDQQKVGLSPKMISYLEQCLDNSDLQIDAFKILNNLVQKGVYNLPDKCLTILNKLAAKLKFERPNFLKDTLTIASNKEYLSIFITLLDVKYINLEVLNNLPSYKYWTRELLSYDLIKRTGEVDHYELEVFDNNLIELEKSRHYDLVSKERDNFLLTLINLQEEYGYTLNQINQILELFIGLPADSISKLDTGDIQNELRIMWLRSKFFPNLAISELQLLSRSLFEENNWTVNVTDFFLQNLSKNADANQISQFLQFIKNNEISFEQVNKVLSASPETFGDKLLIKLQEKLTKYVLKTYIDEQFSKIVGRVTEGQELIKLLEIGWSINAIKELSNSIFDKSKQSLQALQKVLKASQIIYSYKIPEGFVSKDGSTVLKAITDVVVEDLEVALHRLAVEQNFKAGAEKDIETILNEIALKNKDDAFIQGLLTNNILKCEIQDIERKYNSTSAILSNGKPIKSWNKEDIQNWSNLIKGTLAKLPEHQAEILAVIKKANILDSSHEPRIVQQLSVLLMLHSIDSGRLVQISTGEGKSMTVAMLAVVKALRGEVVDVVTSSSVLARRDAEEKVAFYSMFNLSVKDNDNSGYTNLKDKDCYTKNIVYGSADNFQGDLLRDMYHGQNIRKGRPYEVVIIDEVDSMLIDEGSKIVKLSGSLPQMEYLKNLLSLTWRQLEKIEQRFHYSSSTNQLLWIKCDFTVNQGELSLANVEGSYEDNVIEVKNRFEFVRFMLHDYLKQYINKQEGSFVVPSHLRDFALFQIDKWITSAIHAKHSYVEGKHYLVAKEGHKANKIVPVDFANTGILQFKTSWSNGLHQFLEIKHGLKVSPESLTTSFISNMGFFNKYGKNIFGMTGTLGNKDTLELLENIYPIKISFIPTYKHKQFIELPGIIAPDHHAWISEIVNSITSEARKGRATLVICETINEVESIKRALILNNYPVGKINRYARNDNEEHLTVGKNIDSGEVILATNLAGRGTDIKTTAAVEKAGGLHVCLTFLPNNQRIEDQAFGRTSRQGKSGTGQLMVNEEAVLHKLNYEYTSGHDIKAIKDLRDSVEQSRLKQVRYSGLYKTLISDELFSAFNEFYQSLKKQQPKGQFYNSKLKQLEELWGLWLHKASIDVDDNEAMKLSRISFRSYLKEIGFISHNVWSGEDSFYYSIIHQLKYLHIKTNTVDELRHLIINHITDNSALYNNVSADLKQFASNYYKPSEWHDDLFIKAVSRIFEVNIVLIKNDNGYKHYKRTEATQTLYIAQERGGDYLSLVRSDKEANYDTKFENNVENDDAMIKAVSDKSQVGSGGDGYTSLSSKEVIEYFKRLEAEFAKSKGETKLQKHRAEYEKFKQEMQIEYATGRIAKNPSYETVQGNSLLKLNDYNKAITYYDKAIELDKIYSFAAHYNKASAVVGRKGGTAEPKADLLAAKEQIEGHLIPQLESTQMVLVSDSNINVNSELTKQLTNKINLLKLQLDHINKALNVIAIVEQKNKLTQEAIAAGTIKAKKASKFTIGLGDTKALREFYEHGNIPEDEIGELEHLGLENLFTVNEVEILPKKDKGILGGIIGTVLGVGQIIFGTIIAACGAVSFGAAMIIEGVKDLYTVVTGGFKQGFSFEKYFSSKAVNYTIHAITMGMENFTAGLKAIKEGATTVATGVKNITMRAFGGEALKQGAVSEVTNIATQEAVKQGLFKAALEVAKAEVPRAIAQVGAQKAIEFIADQAADNVIKQFRDDIGGSVRGKINDVINGSQTANIIDKAILVDTMLGSNKFTSHIMKEVASILRPEESNFINAASSIIKAIAQKYDSGISSAISFAEKAATVDKILKVTGRFCSRLLDKLPSIASEIPDRQELFSSYMSTVLSKEASIAVYNTLIAKKILNNEGRVIGEDLSKIVEIDFGKSNDFKSRILSYCVKLRDLQDADNKEIRVRVASNIENMITGRIMHLIKADILSPSIATGLSGLSNAMLSKLSDASKAAKEGVRHEMSKHYNRVALTADNESFGNGNYKLPVAAGDESNVASKFKGGDTKSFGDPKAKSSVLVLNPEDSMYFEPLSDQLARPVFIYKNGKIDRVVGSQYKGAEELSFNYAMGKGWTMQGLPSSSFVLTGNGKEPGAANTSILFKKPEDPRIKFHAPYSSYLANGKMVETQKAKPSSASPSSIKPISPTSQAASQQAATDYTLALMGNAKQKVAQLTKGTEEYLKSVFGGGKSQGGQAAGSAPSSPPYKAPVFGIPVAYAGSGTIAIKGGEAIFTLPLTELAAAGGAAAVRALSPLALPVTVYSTALSLNSKNSEALKQYITTANNAVVKNPGIEDLPLSASSVTKASSLLPELNWGNDKDRVVLHRVALGAELLEPQVTTSATPKTIAVKPTNNQSQNTTPQSPPIDFKVMGSIEAQRQKQDPNSLAYTAIDPNANKPKTLSTPDQRDEIAKLGNWPGFTPTPLKGPDILSTPDQSDKIRELTKLPGFNPAPPLTAEDLILYKKIDLDPKNPTERKLFENLDTPAAEFIAKHRQAKILREFPGEYLDVPIKEVLEAAQRKDNKSAITAGKLIKDGRFSK